MKSISDRSCRENHYTHFYVQFFFKENQAVYEIMWKNIVELGRPQMKIWHMHIACWIPESTNTHSEYVIHISLQTHTQNTLYVLLFSCTPYCSICTLPVIIWMYFYCLVKLVAHLPGMFAFWCLYGQLHSLYFLQCQYFLVFYSGVILDNIH